MLFRGFSAEGIVWLQNESPGCLDSPPAWGLAGVIQRGQGGTDGTWPAGLGSGGGEAPSPPRPDPLSFSFLSVLFLIISQVSHFGEEANLSKL